MSSLDGASKGFVAIASIGIIAIGGYSIWKCYKKRGSISPSSLSTCFFEGIGSTVGDLGKDLGKGVWKDVKKGSNAVGKLVKKEGHQFKDNVINPVGKFAKNTTHKTGDFFKKEPLKALNAVGTVFNQKKSNKKIKHFFKSLF